MSAFKVGDVCVIVGADTHKEQIGRQCVIVSGPRTLYPSGTDISYFGCEIEIDGFPSPHHSGKWSCRIEYLRKIDPPSNYDGNQAGEWDLCPWQPKRERA